jgi:hypothetical protein
MKRLISLDLTNNSFRELEITKITTGSGITIWYADCTDPMYLDIDQYTDLTLGRIVELHPNEINLLIIRD